MFDDIARAFAQTFSPPLRRILLKCVGLAVLLLIVLGVILQTLIAHMITLPQPFEMALAIATGLGMIAGAIYLMGPISSLVAALFLDEVAEEIERTNYPEDPVGHAFPIAQTMMLSAKFFGLVLAVNLIALLLLLLPGINLAAFFLANGYLLGREYLELAALRFRPVEEVKAFRQANALRVFLAGLVISGVVAVPLLNLITPVFATVLMVHVHKRVATVRKVTSPDDLY